MIIRIRNGYCVHAALLGAAMSVVGCAGDLPAAFDTGTGSGGGTSGSSSSSGGSSSGPICPDVPTVTFPQKCGMMAGCHTVNATATVYKLDLMSPNVASRLVNVPSGETGQAPAGTLLINAANPSQSAIYTKLAATPPYGLTMPFGLAPLDMATQNCILQYAMSAAASAPAGGSSSSSGGGGTDSGTTTTDSGMGGATGGGG